MKKLTLWHKLYLWRRDLLGLEFRPMSKALRDRLAELSQKDTIAFRDMCEKTGWSLKDRKTRMRLSERTQRRTQRERSLIVAILETIQAQAKML
ncbi:hypothetical protein KAR91_20340 [Candidatus Pacearchaeota archaeon]|nr:hypothetical protein [Candidatus Pacearchaeota archaeon]